MEDRDAATFLEEAPLALLDAAAVPEEAPLAVPEEAPLAVLDADPLDALVVTTILGVFGEEFVPDR